MVELASTPITRQPDFASPDLPKIVASVLYEPVRPAFPIKFRRELRLFPAHSIHTRQNRRLAVSYKVAALS
jgi:hypothetical protein